MLTLLILPEMSQNIQYCILRVNVDGQKFLQPTLDHVGVTSAGRHSHYSS